MQMVAIEGDSGIAQAVAETRLRLVAGAAAPRDRLADSAPLGTAWAHENILRQASDRYLSVLYD